MVDRAYTSGHPIRLGKRNFCRTRLVKSYTCFFHAKAIKHPGYNVSPWNLHERDVTRSNQDEWLVNGQSLHCFHFHNLQQLLKNCKEGEYKDNRALCDLVLSYATA